MRWLGLGLLVALSGCIEENTPAEETESEDAAGPGGDDAFTDPDAAPDDPPDGSLDAQRAPDRGIRPEAGFEEAGFEEAGVFDQGTPPDRGPPEETRLVAGTSTRDGQAYVAWIQGSTLRWQAFEDGEPAGPEFTDRIGARGTALMAATNGETPWLAYASEGQRVQVRTAFGDDPGAPAGLAELHGLAGTPAGALLVGTDEDGVLTWLELGGGARLFIDEMGVPPPDDVLAGRAGTTLRFADAGQCLFLGPDHTPLASTPCGRGAGRLAEADLLVQQQEGDWVARPLFREGAQPLGAAAGPLLARTDGDLALVVATDDGVGLIVGVGERRESAETWPQWPYPRARLGFVRGDGLDVVSFDRNGPPRIDPVALGPPEPWGLDPDRCRPSPEVCNRQDDDCDGVADDGLCCEIQQVAAEIAVDPLEILATDLQNARSWRFATRIEADRWQGWHLDMFAPLGRRVGQMGTCLDQQQCPFDQFPFVCVDGRGENEGYLVCESLETEEQFRRFDVRGAHAGIALVAPGGFTGLIAEDADARPTLWWHHPHRGLEAVNTAPLKAPQQIACEEILAVAVADHSDDLASILVVCPDRVLRMFPSTRYEDVELPLADAEGRALGPLAWAHVTRFSGDVIQVISAEQTPGSLTLHAHNFVADGVVGSMRAQRALPRAIRLAVEAGGDLSRPFVPAVQQAPNLPLLQLPEDTGPVRAYVNTDGDWAWQDILTRRAGQHRYADGVGLVVTSAPIPPQRTGLWFVDVSQPTDLNLWSVNPSHVTGELAYWTVARGPYSMPVFTASRSAPGALQVSALGPRCVPLR